jgi:uncharacterized RDD family membrane protein YckC
LQKITEIRVPYTVKRRETINGVNQFVEKTLVRYADVKTVDGFPRFGHFLLDRVFFYIFSGILGFVLGIILVVTGTSSILHNSSFEIFDTLISWLILQPLYYFIFEVSIQSSPAKAILGRIVVDEYGNKPTAKQILIRCFARAVPFETFSCLGSRGWHDTWSQTYVIRKKDLKELRLLQKINNIQDQPVSNQKD